MTIQNHQIIINNDDTLNTITIKVKGQIVVKEYGLSYVRTKQDSIVALCRVKIVYMNFRTGDIFSFGECKTYVCSADVFYDPFISYARAWIWNGTHLISIHSNREINKYAISESIYGDMHVLDKNTCIYSSQTTVSIYKNGILTHKINNPKLLIKEISYLFNIHKYFVQTDTHFVVVDKNDILKLFEMNDILRYNSNGMVYFTKDQDIVIYESNKYLYIAQTMSPFKINLVRLGEALKHINVCDTTLRAQTKNYTHFFSMFPISLTDSTSIDTTFE